MKVHAIQSNTVESQGNAPQFKGVFDQSFRFLATNQAIGANGVDLAFMVTPRTASDWYKRGPAAGAETLRRESMGTINDTFLALYGIGAGSLLAIALNKKYGFSANSIFAAPETTNILAENKANQLKGNKSQYEYLKDTLSRVKAYNPQAKGADKDGYIRLSEKTVDEVAKLMDESLNNKIEFKDWKKKSAANSRQVVINKIIESTGAEAKYILESADGKIKSETNLQTLLNDTYAISSAFNKDKIKKAFDEQLKAGKPIKDNAFIKGLSKFMKTRSMIGFAVASLVGLSVQPINMYLTKKKTGTDGFVGVEGRQKDNSAGFKGIKALSGAAFFGMVLATMKSTLGQFLGKMDIKGIMPTVNQLKGVYGITIISRIASARDKDELREVLTKDTLGYLSWLVLGDIVNRMVAYGLNKDKSVLNMDEKVKNKGNWLTKSFHASLKTRDEVLIETLAKNGIETTKKDGNKLVAKKFSEMVKDLNKLSPEAKKAAKGKLRVLNIAQTAGYAFSGLVLGLGIPNLNIYITNTLDKKRKAQKAAEQAKTVQEQHNAVA